MSVQSEINRIKGNVTAALAKIAEKGVTVPDGANSDNLEALIEAISAGGGGGSDINIASGCVTFASDVTIGTSAYTFIEDTGLGGPYDICCVTTELGAGAGSGVFCFVGLFIDDIFFAKGVSHYGSYSGSGYASAQVAYASIFKDKVKPVDSKIVISASTTAAKLIAGINYHWIAVRRAK